MGQSKRSINRSISAERWNTKTTVQTPPIPTPLIIAKPEYPSRTRVNLLTHFALRTIFAVKRNTCARIAFCVTLRAMNYWTDFTSLDDVGPETLADYERRAGISVRALLDAIVQDRRRIPPSTSHDVSHSLTCNDPRIKATGALKTYEETKAYKMLIMLAEFRDGATEKFSLRHAYTSANVARATMTEWRSLHPLFDSLMTMIQEEMVDTMRAEAYRRSTVGYEEPIFYQGVNTGEKIRKFSDGLLQFTLMGYDSKFRAKDVNMNVSGSLDSNINIEGLRDKLASRLQAKAKAE